MHPFKGTPDTSLPMHTHAKYKAILNTYIIFIYLFFFRIVDLISFNWFWFRLTIVIIFFYPPLTICHINNCKIFNEIFWFHKLSHELIKTLSTTNPPLIYPL